MRRIFLLISGLAIALGAAAQGAAGGYPNKPIRFVIPYSAGGGTDVLARMIALQVGKQVGQSVVVENKPGASGLIATGFVAKAPPDGYTFLVTDTSFTMIPATRKTMPYDTVKDFQPIAQVAGLPVVIVTAPSLGVNTFAELKAMAAAKPLAYSSGGLGTVFHLLGEMIVSATGMKVDHVPYKGGADALNAVLGGQVQYTLGSVATALPHIKAGKMVAVAVITNGGRSPALPNVPTMSELGFQNLSMTQWFGILAPAGTPPDVVRRIHAEVQKALESAEINGPLTAQGWTIGASSPDEMARLVASDLGRWKQAATAANLQPE